MFGIASIVLMTLGVYAQEQKRREYMSFYHRKKLQFQNMQEILSSSKNRLNDRDKE